MIQKKFNKENNCYILTFTHKGNTIIIPLSKEDGENEEKVNELYGKFKAIVNVQKIDRNVKVVVFLFKLSLTALCAYLLINILFN